MSEDQKQRTFVLGDVHGCYRSLLKLIEWVPFTDEDLIIGVGDYIDRGPMSREVVDWALRRMKRERFIPLRGNHEIMLLNAHEFGTGYKEWLGYGGRETMESYGINHLSDMPADHIAFFDSTRPWCETEKDIITHATIDPDLPLKEQPDYYLFWNSFRNPQPHISGKRTICGHTTQRDGIPKNLGHAVCIDTWVYGEGWLTCLDLESNEYYQANEKGEFRKGALENSTK